MSASVAPYLLLLLSCIVGFNNCYTANPSDAYAWTSKENSYAVRHGADGGEVVTFDDCNKLCIADGYKMLDIGSEDEFELIGKELAQDTENTYWTSGMRNSTNDKFYWEASATEIPSSFWGTGEPKHLDEDKICVEYQWDALSDSHKLFATSPCTGYSACICKKSNSPSPKETLKPFTCSADGMFADPEICNKFHNCVKGGAKYVDYKMSCGTGTVFCSHIKSCGWERDCPCKGQKIE